MWAWSAWSLTVLMGLIFAFGLPLAAATADLIDVAGFPLGFYLCAQAAPILLAALALWLLAWPAALCRLTGLAIGRLTGIALAGLVLSPALVVSAFETLAEDGFDGLIIGQGVMAGLALFALFMARPGARPPQPVREPSPGAAANAARLPFVPGLALVALVALVPLIAAHILAAARIAENWGAGFIAAPVAVVAIVLTVASVALLMPPRLALAVLGVASATLVTGIITLTVLAQPQPPTSPALAGQLPPALQNIPQFAYGQSLSWIATIERDLVVARLSDPVTNHAYARPWTTLSMRDGLASILSIAAAVAALIYVARIALAAPSGGPRLRAPQATVGLAWTVLTTAAVAVTMPALASGLKFAEVSFIARGITDTSLPVGISRAVSLNRASLCARAAERSSGTPSASPAASPSDNNSGDEPEALPDWWLDGAGNTGAASSATANDATTAGAPSLAPQKALENARMPTAEDLDRMIDEHGGTGHLCFAAADRLALGDIRWATWSGRILGLGIQDSATGIGRTTLAHGAEPLLRQTLSILEGVVLAALLAALIGLIALLRLLLSQHRPHQVSPPRWRNAALLIAALAAAAALASAMVETVKVATPSSLNTLSTSAFALLAVGVIPLAAGAALVRRPLSIVPLITAALGLAAVFAYALAPTTLSSMLLPAAAVQHLEPISNAPAWKFDDHAALANACGLGRQEACAAAAKLASELINIAGLPLLAFAALVGLALMILLTGLAAIARLLAPSRPKWDVQD